MGTYIRLPRLPQKGTHMKLHPIYYILFGLAILTFAYTILAFALAIL
jgi:inner membrane protein involved in colicin E2 resistance